jgi:ribosomal protein S18 acetylase RimI-like enzyme
VQVHRVGKVEARALQREVVELYRGAWTETDFKPARGDLDSFGERFLRHSENPDFRMSIARGDQEAMGFAYGYTSVPGGWWRQTVTADLDEDAIRHWFEDCFEFAELAVSPDHQRSGVGAALHDELLDELPHQTAVLSTQQDNEVARSFYDRRGWRAVRENFVFPQKPYPYIILGLDLARRG